MTEVETVVFESHTSESVKWSVDFGKLANINTNQEGRIINSPPLHIKIGSQGTSVKCNLAFQYFYSGSDKFTITFQEELPTTVNSLKFNLDALCYRKNQPPNKAEKISACDECYDLFAVKEKTFAINFGRAIFSGYQAGGNQVYRIVFNLSTETKDYSHKLNKKETSNEDNPAAIAELVADLQNLHQTMDQADVTLKVGKTKIPAHRTILVARSKAFAAMLKDGADEIDIRDMSKDVLKELLRYFYTGKVKQLDLALDLVKIAKASDITHLGDICKKHLEEKMTVDYCLEVLAVAYDFKMPDLKSFTVKFIVEEIDNVQKLDGWTKFINNYPELAVHLVAQFMKTGK